MHTETAATLINNNMQQQQQSHHHHPPQQHQHYVNQQRSMAQDHLLPEQQQHYQQFAHTTTTLPANTTISLNEEGLYTQPHLIASTECPPQYYNNSSNASRSIHCTSSTTSSISTTSSSSSSSCSSNSSNDCNYSNSHTCIKNKSTPSIGVNLRVTGQCSQGGRKYMEDYFSVAYQQSENAKDLEYAFIGIYDGHGGAEAAKFAKEHLMMEIINQRLFWSDSDHDVLRAIREGYIATHYAMWRDQEKWPKTANGLPSTAGTTATVAFIRREKIYIGHVGDSGIVLGYQNENENFWRAKQLTTDHKPESVEERTRIMNSGGKVVVKSGVPRVVWNRPRNASHRGPIRKKTLVDEIPFLAVARSLGDLWSYNSERNEFVVSPDPDVKVIPINSNTFRCLIFGTDGLWNVVGAQEAVNTVREKEIINERLLVQRGDSPHEGNQWTNPSKSLVEQALRTWSNKKMRADNTSVVTVILYPPGQEEHSSISECNKTIGSITNPPSFLQPVSYGLEYTQVQAEVPAYDDTTTYKEMALKYLPPEAYRNFNYYADESDTEGEDNEESEEDEEEDQQVLITAKRAISDLQPNANYNHQLSGTPWNWHANPVDNTLTHVAQEVVNVQRQTDIKEYNEEEKRVCEVDGDNHISAASSRELCIINYPEFVHMEAEETNNATDSYINTFAESYNTILTSQDDCVTTGSASCTSNSNSNSHSNFHSVTPPNMHDILQEQQLYQQQCMSEEEGYSLTKLETRREQQTSKTRETVTTIPTETSTDAIETFKIFHESPTQNVQNSQTFNLYQTNTTERYYHHHQQQQFIPQVQPKPLELQSLLQQEREEEQQVAYERLQMASNYAVEQNQQSQHQNIATYVCLQAIRHEAALTTPSISMDDDDQPAEEVEYLEEEEEDEENDEDEAITNETLYNNKQDKSVQIHEISSSSCGEDSRLEELNSDVEMQETKEMVIEKIEIVPNVTLETSTEYNDSEEKTNTNVIRNKRCTPLNTSKQNSICHQTSVPPLTSLKSCLPHTKKTKSTYLYANVPNENLQRISNSKNNHSIYTNANVTPANRKRSICLASSNGITTSTTTPTPIMQRQLRSTTVTPNASTIDYGKRTLRTRNSLTKDMKAKTTLVTAALKFPHNAVTRNFLRTTSSNLMLLNEQHLTPCNRTRTLKNGNNVRTASRTSIKTGREKPAAINGSLNHSSKCNLKNSSHHLNLRSRHQTSSATKPTGASDNTPTTANVVNVLRSSPATSTTTVINRASLTDRRILRSMHTRSSASKGSQTPANFSKSTKSQSMGSNLAAPPPSPKMINAVAAAAAATRARSLLNAKHAAAANGSRSVVEAVFGKRSNLRSNGSTHPPALPATAVVTPTNSSPSVSSSTHQTQRGRIVKKLKR